MQAIEETIILKIYWYVHGIPTVPCVIEEKEKTIKNKKTKHERQ